MHKCTELPQHFLPITTVFLNLQGQSRLPLGNWDKHSTLSTGSSRAGRSLLAWRKGATGPPPFGRVPKRHPEVMGPTNLAVVLRLCHHPRAVVGVGHLLLQEIVQLGAICRQFGGGDSGFLGVECLHLRSGSSCVRIYCSTSPSLSSRRIANVHHCQEGYR